MHFRAGQFAAAAVLVVTGLAVPAHAAPNNHPKDTPLTEEECKKGGGVSNTKKDNVGREVDYCAGGTHNQEPLGK